MKSIKIDYKFVMGDWYKVFVINDRVVGYYDFLNKCIQDRKTDEKISSLDTIFRGLLVSFSNSYFYGIDNEYYYSSYIYTTPTTPISTKLVKYTNTTTTLNIAITWSTFDRSPIKWVHNT